MDEVRIDWAEATVDGGQLTVPLAGEPTKEWAERVASVIDRLHAGSGWGAIKVTKKKVTVADVTAGAEPDLRHLLESAVLQANADLAPTETSDGDDERSDDDVQMTEAFRAFAPAETDEG